MKVSLARVATLANPRWLMLMCLSLGLVVTVSIRPALADPFTSVTVAAGQNNDSASNPSGATILGINDFSENGAADAFGTADFGALGATANGSALPDLFPTIGSDAIAIFEDLIHVSGPGATASVTFELDLSGTCTATPGATNGFPNAGCFAQGTMVGGPELLVGVDYPAPTSSSVTLLLPTDFFEPINVKLEVGGFAYDGAYAAGFGTTLHTYIFSTTPGVVITSQSGHDYDLPTAVTPVPEPGTLLLLASGCAVAGRRLRSGKVRRSTNVLPRLSVS